MAGRKVGMYMMNPNRRTKSFMAKRPKNDGKTWGTSEVKTLRSELRDGSSVRAIAKSLSRTPEATRKKALRERISLITGRKRK